MLRIRRSCVLTSQVLLMMESMSLPRISVNLPGVTSATDADDGMSTLFPQLSLKERIIGFAVCLALGFLISLSSFGAITQLMLGHPLRFAVLYSLGNLTSICSTLFLVGFKRQYRNMTKHSRRISAGIYLFCLSMTLVTAFAVPQLKWLIVALVVTQWGALLWYTLSYIPFGRRMATGLANRLLG